MLRNERARRSRVKVPEPDAPRTAWATYYRSLGVALCAIPPGTKAPTAPGWPSRNEDPAHWVACPEDGLGAVLGPSGLVSLDLDALAESRELFAALGLDLDALTAGACQVRGNPARLRVLFRAPAGSDLSRRALAWPAREPGGKSVTVFELRAGPVQDVLPPSLHPETGRPYEWVRAPWELSERLVEPPAELLELWRGWDAWRPALEALCPWSKPAEPSPRPRAVSDGLSVIAELNRSHEVGALLEAHGYRAKGRNRWIAPSSESRLPGVVRLPESGRVFSHHGSDPLATGHALDAFEVYALLEHGGVHRAAVKAAAEALGLTRADAARGQAEGAASPSPAPGAEPPLSVGVTLIDAAGIRPEPVSWLWPGYLARGKVHVLAGAPGTGKTTLALALAATLTVAGRWPDGTDAPRGSVVVWSGEDDPKDTLVPRLIAAGADTRRVRFVASCTDDKGPRPFDPARDVPALSDELARDPPALLIVDPIVSTVAGDSHKNAEVRRALQPLVELGQLRRCAVLGISHFSKGTAGRDPTERVTGSLAFGALARVVLAAAKLPEDQGGGRILARAKNNLGADSGGFRFDLEPWELETCPGVHTTRVIWGEPLEGTARELLGQAEAQSDPDERTALDEAKGFLLGMLADGPMPARQIMREANEAGHAERTLKRAKAALGIEARKGAGMKEPWTWELPPGGAKGANGKGAEGGQPSPVSEPWHSSGGLASFSEKQPIAACHPERNSSKGANDAEGGQGSGVAPLEAETVVRVYLTGIGATDDEVADALETPERRAYWLRQATQAREVAA